MITYFIHFILSLILVYVSLDIFVLPLNPLIFTIIFLIYYSFFWLISYFYDKNHFRKIPKLINFIFYFLYEIIKANFRLAYEVLTPLHNMKPGVIAFPLDAKTDLEITLFANIISLTPGSLSLDVSKDKKTLYIHAVFIDDNDVEEYKRKLKNGLEKKLLAITK